MKLVAHDAAEVQDETTSPIDEEETRNVVVLGRCPSLNAVLCTAWARSGAPSSTDVLRLPRCKPRPLEMLNDRWSRRDRREQSAG